MARSRSFIPSFKKKNKSDEFGDDVKPDSDIKITPPGQKEQPISKPVDVTPTSTPRPDETTQPGETPGSTNNKEGVGDVFQDPNTGNVTGVTKDGTTFLGDISKDEGKGILEAKGEQEQLLSLREQPDISQVPQEEQQQALSIIDQVQQRGGVLSEEDKASMTPSQLDYVQAVLAGLSQGLTGAVGTALSAGIVTGAGSNPVSWAAVGGGAAVGLIGGFLRGFRANIATQISGVISAKGEQSFSKIEQSMRAAITDLNGGGNVIVDTKLFYLGYAGIERNHAQLQIDEKRLASRTSGKDATTQLEIYENFFRYTYPQLQKELLQAINNPDPNKILVDEFEMKASLDEWGIQ